MKSTLAKEGIPFTQTPNDIINDPSLSDTAVRCYLFMSSKPPGWNFTLSSMAAQMEKSARTVGNAVRELKKSGWVGYEKKRTGKGVYTLYNSPSGKICRMQDLQDAKSANSKIGRERNLPHISNTDNISNTDLNSNKDKIKNPKDSLQKDPRSHFENCSKKLFKEITDLDIEKFSEKEKMYFRTAHAFYTVFKRNLKARDVPPTILEKSKFGAFVDPIRKMYEIDNLERSHMIKLWEFLKVDEFWAANVQSTAKLRKQFTQLLMKSSSNHGKTTAAGREPQYSHEFIEEIINGLGGSTGNKTA